MAGHSGLLVGGRVEVGQAVEGTLRGPGPVLQPGYNIVMNVVHYIENSSGEYEQFCHTLPRTDSCSSMSLSEGQSALHEGNSLRAGGRQHQHHQYHHRTVAGKSV